MWCSQVNRKDAASGKNWEPTRNSRICSVHFIDGCPTHSNADPTLHLGMPVSLSVTCLY